MARRISLAALGNARLAVERGINVVAAAGEKNAIDAGYERCGFLARIRKWKHDRLRARGLQRLYIRGQSAAVVLGVAARRLRDGDADHRSFSLMGSLSLMLRSSTR